MKQVIVALCLLIAGATPLGAVPAPVARKSKPVVQPPWPTPGKYLVTWGSSQDGDGEILNDCMGWYWFHDTKFYFIWEFDRETRTFTMWEAAESRGSGQDKMNRYAKEEMFFYSFPLMKNELRTPENFPGSRLHFKRK